MAIDLFSLVLPGVTSWAIGRLLDTMMSCGRCGSTCNRDVPNYAATNLLCPSCHGSLNQYTNATSHTVQQNGAIGAAYVSGISWEGWGGYWGTRFKPRFRVDCVNSRYEDLVVRFELSQFQGSCFYRDDMILRPGQSNRVWWDDIGWNISPNTFPKAGGTFAVDVKVLNTWGEELHRARSLGDHAGRRD